MKTAGVRKPKGNDESRRMEGPEKLETKVESKGEPEEAAAEIEAGGRRKEIADDAIR